MHAERGPLLRPILLVLVASSLALVALAANGAGAQQRTADAPPYLDQARPIAERVDDLLGRMSLDDKLGQMTLVDRSALGNQADVTTYRLGAVFNGGSSAPSPNHASSWADTIDSLQRSAEDTPLRIPLLYGVNAVHGHNGLWGATIFPHNIGLGASGDPELVAAISRATAEEMAGTGANWNFAPCLCVARDDRWGRTYESFGETPELVASMASAISGYQDGTPAVLATAKHYLGDGGTTGGVDQGDAALSEAELRAVHLPPFAAAVQRDVGSVMLSFSSWNGARLHAHRYLITDVLKDELAFRGFVVSDWAAVDRIDGASGLTAAEVRSAINAGLDMVMVPYDFRTFLGLLRTEVRAGRIPLQRIDDANRRILTQKFELGLFEQRQTDRRWTPTVGDAAHRDLARRAVRESIVLLRNDGGVLPLPRHAGKLFVAGRAADDIGIQSGGWTMSWQGGIGDITPGTTVLEAVRATVSPDTTVTYQRDGYGIDSSYRAAIAVVGETPYAEGRGDRRGTMSLDPADRAVLERLRAAGVPVVVVLISGRPLDIAAEVAQWDGLLAAWLPGTEGQGVADVLFGDHNPTGRLPLTWMADAAQQPINHGDGQEPLWPYGFGLNYPTDTVPAQTAPAQTVPAQNIPADTIPIGMAPGGADGGQPSSGNTFAASSSIAR
ncbi:MAG: glycoside hydrolase family 3 C-terminal domain-containing protein [Acidimicrobiales bacterium]|nr:glycoside hydrolase family 3 C-terminal domain-containing protein [Acidimicrobiales bacterium]